MSNPRRVNDTNLALRILGRIEEHGIENPIKIRTLQEEFNLTERDIKAFVRSFRLNGHKIGSSKREPYGLFKAKHPSEIKETADRFFSDCKEAYFIGKQLLNWSEREPTVFEQLPEIPGIEGDIDGRH